MERTGGDQISAFLVGGAAELLRGRLVLAPGFETLRPTNRYETLRGRLDGSLVIIYSTGKVVFDRSESIRRIIEEVAYSSLKEEGTILGSDEAGKGELIGPLVVAAVCLNPKQAAKLISWGVADSKVVPPDRIHELAQLIARESMGHKVISIPPLKFNSLYEAAAKQGKNLNDILAEAHSEAIRSVLEQVDAPTIRIVVDEFDSTRSKKRLKIIEGISSGRQVSSTPRAEVVPSVAAASVLARDGYLTWLEENLDEEQIAKLKRGRFDIVKRASDMPRVYKTSYLNVTGRTTARETKSRKS
jgi:ribonuclease HIII